MSAILIDIGVACAGLFIVVLVFVDVFQSIIVPHYTPKGARLSPRLVSKILWPPLRQLAKAFPDNADIRGTLNAFAPAAIMAIIGGWVFLMTMGYALILWAERAQVKPTLENVQQSFYFAATSLLTVGFGDFLACSSLARFTVMIAALSGIVILAITVSFLFAIQSHFHTREVNAQLISSRHEHSANGAMFYANLRKDSNAAGTLELCERWLIEIYQSHSAYPLLLYFRSRSTKASWLVQMGAVLDAAAIGLALESQKNTILKRSIYDSGSRALSVFCTYLGLDPRKHETQQDATLFEPMFEALGSPNPVQAAGNFATLRRHYYPELYALADFLLLSLPALSLFDAAQLREQRPRHLAPKDKKHIPGHTATFDWPTKSRS